MSVGDVPDGMGLDHLGGGEIDIKQLTQAPDLTADKIGHNFIVLKWPHIKDQKRNAQI